MTQVPVTPEDPHRLKNRKAVFLNKLHQLQASTVSLSNRTGSLSAYQQYVEHIQLVANAPSDSNLN